jgi:hypothetical protein
MHDKEVNGLELSTVGSFYIDIAPHIWLRLMFDIAKCRDNATDLIVRRKVYNANITIT